MFLASYSYFTDEEQIRAKAICSDPIESEGKGLITNWDNK